MVSVERGDLSLQVFHLIVSELGYLATFCTDEMVMVPPQMPVLVSVGRGIQGEENIEVAEELAAQLGGALSASRPVVDQGWLPLSRQVGRSGMIVKPSLYLALGISGAPEHLEGMTDSEMIIAVNTDADAPIFGVAHFGIQEDVNEFVPALKQALEERPVPG